jgi:hypothetical protein
MFTDFSSDSEWSNHSHRGWTTLISYCAGRRRRLPALSHEEREPDPPCPAGLSTIGEAGPRPGVGGPAATIGREGAIEDLQD